MIISPIKTQGKKTKIIPYILNIIPSLNNTLYVEPFLGSGEVLFNVNPDHALVSDNNCHIINFFKALQNETITPNMIRSFLELHGEKLQKFGRSYYYEMRNIFNTTHDPLYFLFINRSCFNGVMRFNNKGAFNVPFCNNDNRFTKAFITKIVNQVATIQKIILGHGNNWEFICCDWEDLQKHIITSCDEKFFYFDPPYVERHATYYDSWSEEKNEKLFSFISSLCNKFILSNWLSNTYRVNHYINQFFDNFRFNVLPLKHFYHVGGHMENRNAIVECLITNFI